MKLPGALPTFAGMSNQTKWWIYLVSFSLLLAGFFYFSFRGTQYWKSGLPVVSYVRPFSFMNQSGQAVTEKMMVGNVYVANYFFTSCTGICPNMNGKLQTVYDLFKGNPRFKILSHTCQPEVDSIAELKSYANLFGADGKQWQFVTGDKLELYRMARESYLIDDPANNVGLVTDQFLHSQFLALVDTKGSVRGIYDGLKQKEVNRLKKDIAALLEEE